MEPLAYTISFRAKVIAVEHKTRRNYISGVGKDARFEEISAGWWIGLEKSHEWLFAGNYKPNVFVGYDAIVRIDFYGKPAPL